MMACYMVYSGLFADPLTALDHFAIKRSKIENGVKQASQLRYPSLAQKIPAVPEPGVGANPDRYVQYFYDVLKDKVRPKRKVMKLARVVMNGIPVANKKTRGCTPVLQVYSVSSFPAEIVFSSAWVDEISTT